MINSTTPMFSRARSATTEFRSPCFRRREAPAQRAVEAIEAAHRRGRLGFANLPSRGEAGNANVLAFAREHAFKNIRHSRDRRVRARARGARVRAWPGPMRRRSSSCSTTSIRTSSQVTLEALNPADTFVNVIAKSGVTAETMATFADRRKWMIDALGASATARSLRRDNRSGKRRSARDRASGKISGV